MGADAAPAAFKYRAFLSYSHRDEIVAARLHRALERYRVPRQLIGQPNVDGQLIPSSLFPVFRDRDELAASPNLPNTLRRALEETQHLVVICSPAAAVSRWVDQEVLTFKRLGRAAQIHALVIGGDPSASPGSADACFPPALCAVLDADGTIVEGAMGEPVAADLRPQADGEANATLKIIAAVLGVPFDTLRQREAIAARARSRLRYAIIAGVALLGIGGGLASWLALQFEQQADERQLPGVRMENHQSTLDLSGWQPTNADDIAGHVKRSLGVATDSYTLVKTQEFATNYVHIIGTTSDIPPEVSCEHCRVVDRHRDGASRTAHEYRLIFDISQIGLEDRYSVRYTTKYWNAFQTPSQWWSGVRISDLTEEVRFDIIFPPSKYPAKTGLKFSYFDRKDHPYPTLPDVTFVPAPSDPTRVSRLSWRIAHPLTDRSYRVSWDWTR